MGHRRERRIAPDEPRAVSDLATTDANEDHVRFTRKRNADPASPQPYEGDRDRIFLASSVSRENPATAVLHGESIQIVNVHLERVK